jgi:hypothetical protein
MTCFLKPSSELKYLSQRRRFLIFVSEATALRDMTWKSDSPGDNSTSSGIALGDDDLVALLGGRNHADDVAGPVEIWIHQHRVVADAVLQRGREADLFLASGR